MGAARMPLKPGLADYLSAVGLVLLIVVGLCVLTLRIF